MLRHFNGEVVKTGVFWREFWKTPFFDSRDGKMEEDGERWAGTLCQSQNPIMKYARKPPITTNDIYSCFSLSFKPKEWEGSNPFKHDARLKLIC